MTVRAVADELAKDEIGLVVIGSAADITGVISERDVVRAVPRRSACPPRRPTTSRARRLCGAIATATVREVAELMMEQYVRHVLLEEEGRLVGIISAHDVLGAFAISST